MADISLHHRKQRYVRLVINKVAGIAQVRPQAPGEGQEANPDWRLPQDEKLHILPITGVALRPGKRGGLK
jgi:hypothetical protein